MVAHDGPCQGANVGDGSKVRPEANMNPSEMGSGPNARRREAVRVEALRRDRCGDQMGKLKGPQQLRLRPTRIPGGETRVARFSNAEAESSDGSRNEPWHKRAT